MGCIFIKMIVGGNIMRDDNILKAKSILESLYETTLCRIDINITKMIFLIKNRTHQLSSRDSNFILTSSLIDLCIATDILLNEVEGCNYMVFREVRRCLSFFKKELDSHNTSINNLMIQNQINYKITQRTHNEIQVS